VAKPVKFDQATKVLVAPKDMTDEECGRLYVHAADGIVTSCWELTQDELAEIALNGGRLFVHVWSGESQPPIAIGTANPFVT
jgi:hypothetical protein